MTVAAIIFQFPDFCLTFQVLSKFPLSLMKFSYFNPTWRKSPYVLTMTILYRNSPSKNGRETSRWEWPPLEVCPNNFWRHGLWTVLHKKVNQKENARRQHCPNHSQRVMHAPENTKKTRMMSLGHLSHGTPPDRFPMLNPNRSRCYFEASRYCAPFNTTACGHIISFPQDNMLSSYENVTHNQNVNDVIRCSKSSRKEAV